MAGFGVCNIAHSWFAVLSGSSPSAQSSHGKRRTRATKGVEWGRPLTITQPGRSVKLGYMNGTAKIYARCVTCRVVALLTMVLQPSHPGFDPTQHWECPACNARNDLHLSGRVVAVSLAASGSD